MFLRAQFCCFLFVCSQWWLRRRRHAGAGGVDSAAGLVLLLPRLSAVGSRESPPVRSSAAPGICRHTWWFSPGQVRQSSNIPLWRGDQRFLPDPEISLQNYLFLSINVFLKENAVEIMFSLDKKIRRSLYDFPVIMKRKNFFFRISISFN